MSSLASSSPTALVRAPRWRRTAFAGLLLAAALVPHLSSDGFDFPAVTDFWSLLPFCGLFGLALVDLRSPWRLLHADLLALLSFAVALGCWRDTRTWPVLLIYPPLLYLGARMISLARIGRSAQAKQGGASLRVFLPRRWLLAGIVVLAGVHVSWALEGATRTDVAEGGVTGALSIAHGRPLYAKQRSPSGVDPHTDTYGPLNYEAYIPFALIANRNTAARLTTLFFELLTALLLFALGRQIRGPTAGVLLAFCWLAYPFTLYEEAFAFNDSILAASLVGTVLVARSPLRRGAIAAVAVWTKLSPLALLPLLAGHRGSTAHGARRGALEFAAAFALLTALIFVPALAHSTPSAFMSRTFGFQGSRPASGSLWALLQGGAPWVSTVSRIVHGLLAALVGGFAVVLLRAPRRQDAVGIAAAAAAVLIAVELCLGYYAFSYILWFAPLALVAVILAPLAKQTDTASTAIRRR
ncbi:MAG: glycosyltransferase 87 family protein [Solirubrobacteraceae bacterium]